MSSMRIAVVIPYFQRDAGILVRALRSIEAQQGVDDVVVVVVDDASPISAKDELARWEGQRRFPIEVIEQANGGPAAARNRGLDAVSNDVRYIAFLDSDDEWTGGHLAHALQGFQAGHDFYFSDHYQLEQSVSAFRRAGRIDPARHPRIAGTASLHRYEGDMFNQVLTGNVIGTSTAVLSRESLGDLRFESSLVSAGEDYLFWMACARHGASFCFSTDVEVSYGAGVNVYSGAIWGTNAHLARVYNEMKYRKILKRDSRLDAKQKRFVDVKIKELRRDFVMSFLHRIAHERSVDMPILKAQARLDPATIFQFPLISGLQVAERIKRAKK